MSVYVDDMQAAFGRMKMWHMKADSTTELLEMVDKINVARKWMKKQPVEKFNTCGLIANESTP